MARHMQGYVPDNPRAVPPTPEEQQAMWTDDWLAGTACETCRYRESIGIETMQPHGWRPRDIIHEFCLEAHDNNDGSGCFELTAKTVQDTCPDWEMED